MPARAYDDKRLRKLLSVRMKWGRLWEKGSGSDWSAVAHRHVVMTVDDVDAGMGYDSALISALATLLRRCSVGLIAYCTAWGVLLVVSNGLIKEIFRKCIDVRCSPNNVEATPRSASATRIRVSCRAADNSACSRASMRRSTSGILAFTFRSKFSSSSSRLSSMTVVGSARNSSCSKFHSARTSAWLIGGN